MCFRCKSQLDEFWENSFLVFQEPKSQSMKYSSKQKTKTKYIKKLV